MNWALAFLVAWPGNFAPSAEGAADVGAVACQQSLLGRGDPGHERSGYLGKPAQVSPALLPQIYDVEENDEDDPSPPPAPFSLPPCGIAVIIARWDWGVVLGHALPTSAGLCRFRC